MPKRGLPTTVRMRHDEHYVEALASSAGTPVGRLVPIDEGDIRIDGRSVRDMPLTELRRGIGYVIQQVGLFPHMTVGANVATVPRLLGWPRNSLTIDR